MVCQIIRLYLAVLQGLNARQWLSKEDPYPESKETIPWRALEGGLPTIEKAPTDTIIRLKHNLWDTLASYEGNNRARDMHMQKDIHIYICKHTYCFMKIYAYAYTYIRNISIYVYLYRNIYTCSMCTYLWLYLSLYQYLWYIHIYNIHVMNYLRDSPKP